MEFPDEPVDEFPAPPHDIEDAANRTIHLREADSTDSEVLLEMYLEFEPEDRAQGIPPVREEGIRDWLDVLLAPHCYNVIARHEERVVGHSVLVPDERGAYELAIFVLQPYQGAGIGTSLLETLLGLGQDQGVETVWLTVERWNEPAIRLYRKVGFETVEAESFELEMSIRLAPASDQTESTG